MIKFEELNGEPLSTGVLNGIEWACYDSGTCINGYLRIPKGHPLLKEKSLMMTDKIDVHGAITFHRNDIIGFDTSHYGDITKISHLSVFSADAWREWPLEAVEEETKRMVLQVAEMGVGDE